MHFCVVGTGRCGTTLLWDMLNLHPELFVFRESHWIPKMYEFFGTGTGDATDLVDIVLRTTHVTGELVYAGDLQVLQSLFPEGEKIGVAAFCDRIGSLFARNSGKKYWADKTPDYGPHMGSLQSLWPSCRFIHLIRDGVRVVHSMSHHPGFRWMATAREAWWVAPSFNGYHRSIEATERPLCEFVALWYRRFRRIRDEAKRLQPGTYLEVRFEDLAENPEDSLLKVCRFVGLKASDNWLSAAKAKIDWRRVDRRPPEDFIKYFEDAERRLLEELGYL